MSGETAGMVWGVGYGLVLVTALVWLSVDIHRGAAGDDYSGYILGGIFGGAFWPIVVAGYVICGVFLGLHRFIGLFVPRPVPVAPEDATLAAARLEVEKIAPSES